MSTETMNIDVTSFEPKQGTKRKTDDLKSATVNGIEGSSRKGSSAEKKKKWNSDEMRKVPVPAHRYTPLKENWLKIFTPIVEHLQLQVRFNLKTRNVEIRTCESTKDIGNLQKAADFVKVRMEFKIQNL